MCVVHNIPFLPSAALNRKYASDLAFYSVSQTQLNVLTQNNAHEQRIGLLVVVLVDVELAEVSPLVR